jgi:hypothetical protein
MWPLQEEKKKAYKERAQGLLRLLHLVVTLLAVAAVIDGLVIVLAGRPGLSHDGFFEKVENGCRVYSTHTNSNGDAR